MKKVFVLSFLVMLTSVAIGQKGKSEIQIRTNAQCSMCKEKLESALIFEKGVKKVDVNLETGLTTVVFLSKKTDADALRKIISMVGYKADDVEADPEARAKLDACCRVEGKHH